MGTLQEIRNSEAQKDDIEQKPITFDHAILSTRGASETGNFDLNDLLYHEHVLDTRKSDFQRY